MNSWKSVVLAQSKITKEWKIGGNDLVQSSLRSRGLHLVETSLAWSRVEALVITTAAAMVVVVPKQTKEPFQSCYQVFPYFHKIFVSGCSILCVILILSVVLYFVSGCTPFPSPACLLFLPQVQDPPLGRKNLKMKDFFYCLNRSRLFNWDVNLKSKILQTDLSSPSACLFLLPHPVWGADTACGETVEGEFFWRSLKTWLSVGPSTAAPRAPRPSPMMPPSIALFPVENILGVFLSQWHTWWLEPLYLES